jgi:hypothetical protein
VEPEPEVGEAGRRGAGHTRPPIDQGDRHGLGAAGMWAREERATTAAEAEAKGGGHGGCGGDGS